MGLLLPLQCLAWGTLDHQVIAMVAEQHLTPKAQAQVKRLLALEAGSTLASISTWADEHRNPKTAPWHYVNFPRGNCSFEPERDCPEGQCVVRAIDDQVKVLKSGADDELKLKALKYLVHFVGDVHQPLHAGYGDDRGGNQYQLQAFMRGTNLHAFWDTGLISYVSVDVNEWMARLKSQPLPPAVAAQTLDTVQIAQESCRIVATEGFYPSRLVEANYVERFAPVAEQRLHCAALRLAGMLNGVWT